MLEFTSLKNKKASNEVLTIGGIIYIVGCVIAFIAMLFAAEKLSERPDYEERSKESNKEKKKEKEKKLLTNLIDHYPDVCKYINTELKDDPFFFKDEHDLERVDVLSKLLKERVEKIRKIQGFPVPSKTDTKETYYNKLKTYFSGQKIDMSSSYYECFGKSDTYSNSGWLDGAKVSSFLRNTRDLNTLETNFHRKVYNVRYDEYDDEAELSDGTTVESVLSQFLGKSFLPINSSDYYYSMWMAYIQYSVTSQILMKIAKHLTSHLSAKYGKDKIKEIIRKNYNKGV